MFVPIIFRIRNKLLINDLKAIGHYIYHQVSIKKILLCPHSIFVCFVWIWEQTTIISLQSINWLVFYNRDRACLLRGTAWVFVYNSVVVCKGSEYRCCFGRVCKIAKRDYLRRRAYLSLCPSVWNNSAPSGRIFVNYVIWVFLGKSVEKIQVWLTL